MQKAVQAGKHCLPADFMLIGDSCDALVSVCDKDKVLAEAASGDPMWVGGSPRRVYHTLSSLLRL